MSEKRRWDFGFCSRCGEPFVTENDICTVRDSVTDDIVEVCRRCYKDIVESDEGFTRYGGIEELVEDEIARLKDIVSKRVEDKWFELLEDFKTPLSRYVNWYVDKDGRLIVEVKGESRGVKIVIDRDRDYSDYYRVEVSDWCMKCKGRIEERG